MIRLETVLDSWRSVRQDTAQAVEDVPADQLGFKAAPEVASFGEIARHILNAGHGLTGMLLAGIDNFATPEFRRDMVRYASGLVAEADAQTIAAALRSALDERLAALRAQPADWFSAIITRFDGQALTRLEMIQSIKEHELTHRAQLFMCLRLLGIVPVTTRRRQAAGR
jgi:uncharacterized damage-inducible protein DinB